MNPWAKVGLIGVGLLAVGLGLYYAFGQPKLSSAGTPGTSGRTDSNDPALRAVLSLPFLGLNQGGGSKDDSVGVVDSVVSGAKTVYNAGETVYGWGESVASWF